MWELIAQNKRKSWIIFICMGACLAGIGYAIGIVWFPPEGGFWGIIIALAVWFVLSLISYFSGDAVLLLSSQAKEVTSDFHPQLFNVVEEMKIAASLETIPKIYIIPSPALNAFAAGKSPKKCSIAITSGLLAKLNRDELQGVIAHEMSHIINRDVLYMTIAGVMLGSIVILSQVFLRSMWFSSGSRRYSSSSSRGGGQAQLIIFVAAIIFAILAPILARIFYFSLSRKREYLADAQGVRLTRYPEGLASALEKISGSSINLESANKITAPMYIDIPFRKKGRKTASLFSTHPPAKERIRILRTMMQGVNYTEYQKAFSQVKGGSSFMPQSALKDSKALSIRKASIAQSKEKGAKSNARDAGDLMRALNQYLFLTCLCGLRIKIPPNFKKPKITCPRCGRSHEVPLVDAKTIGAVLGATKTLP